MGSFHTMTTHGRSGVVSSPDTGSLTSAGETLDAIRYGNRDRDTPVRLPRSSRRPARPVAARAPPQGTAGSSGAAGWRSSAPATVAENPSRNPTLATHTAAAPAMCTPTRNAGTPVKYWT